MQVLQPEHRRVSFKWNKSPLQTTDLAFTLRPLQCKSLPIKAPHQYSNRLKVLNMFSARSDFSEYYDNRYVQNQVWLSAHFSVSEKEWLSVRINQLLIKNKNYLGFLNMELFEWVPELVQTATSFFFFSLTDFSLLFLGILKTTSPPAQTLFFAKIIKQVLSFFLFSDKWRVTHITV